MTIEPGCEAGICGGEAPAIVVRDGERWLTRAGVRLEDAIEALGRGEIAGLDAREVELVRWWADRR